MQSEELRSSEFWGICCEGGKKYSQVVRQRFHMTMAALDPTVVPTSPIVSLMVDRGGCEYLLCSLKPGSLLQVNLNLYFDKGEKVTFSLRGNGKIHLSGYHIYGKNEVIKPDVAKSSEANKVLGKELPSSPKKVPAALNIPVAKPASPKKDVCSPNKANKKAVVAQVTVDDSDSSSSDSEEEKPTKLESKTVSPKKTVQNLKESIKKVENDDEDSDDDIFDDLDDEESDEDENKDSKKDGKRLQTYKRLWSSLTQSDDEEEESDSSDSDEDDEKEASKKSAKALQQNKKLKNAASTPVSVKKAKDMQKKTDVVNAGSTKKTPKLSDDLNSSVGRTPMPKKTPKLNNMPKDNAIKISNLSLSKDSDDSSDSDNTNAKNTSMKSPISEKKDLNESASLSASKKKKKKKKKSAELNASNASDGGVGNKEKIGLSSASFSKKLSDGLSYEDIRNGNGPVAKKGKLVHVYYTGMLENNKVFDSCKTGGKPFSFKLGSGQVIKGWDMGIEGMQVGGKRRLKIPANLGYKSQRMGPIPPNSTLYFTVELKAVS